MSPMSASKTCLTTVVAEGLRASCRDHSEFLDLVLGARNAISAAVVATDSIEFISSSKMISDSENPGYARNPFDH